MFKMFVFSIALLSMLFVACDNNTIKEENSKKNYNCQCLVDKLNNKDTLFIYYQTHGCFHSYSEMLKLYYTADKLTANLQLENHRDNQRTSVITSTVPDSSVAIYSDLEIKCQQPEKDGGCTTTEHFEISLNNKKIKHEHNDCSMDDYPRLVRSIFGQDKIQAFYNQVVLENVPPKAN